MHRVAGPLSSDTSISRPVLRAAASATRYSLAFFADPDQSVKLQPVTRVPAGSKHHGFTVAAYVRWRAGEGIGVSFDGSEAKRVPVES